MLKVDRLARGATITLETCLGLHEDEAFLLIFDESTIEFVPIFQKAARSLNIRFHKAFVSKDLQAKGQAAFRGHVTRALAAARGVLVATTDDERCTGFRIILTSERRQAASAMATMPGASLSILASALDVDYQEIIRSCRELTVPLLRGKKCLIRTFDRDSKPYDLVFQLPGLRRPPIQSFGIIARQAWGNVPAGETFVAPIETSANGRYVVNGAVGTEKLPKSKDAILTFKDGILVEHEYLGTGSPVKHLTKLKAIAEASGHGACWSTIAEFGIGLNKHIKHLTGVQLVDEKKYGTVHIAIGHNLGYGGATKCGSVHCDMTTMNPTVWIDDRLIIKRGKHIVDFSAFKSSYRATDRSPDGWDPTWAWIKLNDDTYDLDASGRLWVKLRTSSGRETLYALGDDETCLRAHDLVSLFDGHQSMDFEAIQSALRMSASDCLGLLTLLYREGVVSP